MKVTRSKLCIAFAVAIVNAAHAAIAAEPAQTESGRKKETRTVATPMEPGPDGWYEATAADASFRIRMPGVYSGFAQDGSTDAGAVTYTVGVRANLAAAFGVQTSYVASCIQQKGDERTAMERLQSVIDRWNKIGTMRYRKNLESASLPGLEFEMADDVKVMRARLFAPAAGTCTLLVTWRVPAKPSEADLEKFFGSFEIARR